MKQLIVQGDDLGYSREINNGIFYCYENGILTTTTVMINLLDEEKARYLNNDIGNLKNKSSLIKQKLHLGIHLNLTFGKPLFPGWPQSEFTRPFKNDPEKQWDKHNWIGYFNQFKASDVETEFRLQIEKSLKYFDNIDHLDSHHFCASYDPVKSIYEKMAKEYKLAARPAAPLIDNSDSPNYGYSSNDVRHLRLINIKCADGYLLNYYNKNEDPVKIFLNDLEKTNSTSLEVMFHPAKGENAEAWRAKDLQILVDPIAIEYMHKKIKLITYADL